MTLTIEQQKQNVAAYDAHAKGLPVEELNRYSGVWKMSPKPNFDSKDLIFRPAILTFPDPPPGEVWQNPEGLDAATVGVHEGWRLLLKSEIIERTSLSLDFQRYAENLAWDATGWTGSCKGYTYRTKLPLPATWSLSRHLHGFRELAPGEQWHREDWTREMLPDGWRPALLKEKMQPGDELDYEIHDHVMSWTEIRTTDRTIFANDGSYFYRTQRPLPALRIPWDCADDVPKGGAVFLRHKEIHDRWWQIIYANLYGIGIKGDFLLWHELDDKEWSLTREEFSWSPCDKPAKESK